MISRAILSLFMMLMFSEYSWAQVGITFKVCDLEVESDVLVGIRGSMEPLSWEKSTILALNEETGCYEGMVEFPESDKQLEYKFITEAGSELQWEGISNRIEMILSNDTTFSSSWNIEKVIDPSSLPMLTLTELKEDFQVVKDAILKVHPGLYRYNTKEEVAANLKRLKEDFSVDLTYGQAYLALSKFAASIKCDHTSASFWNQEATINSLIHRQRNKIPFTYRWIGERMFVLKNASSSPELVQGTEILSINGVNSSEILTSLLPYIPADGATDHNKVRKAEVDGVTFRFSAFDVLFPLLYSVSDEFSLQVRAPGKNEAKPVIVSALTRDQRAEILSHRYENFATKGDDLWDARILDDSIAYLEIGSFGTGRFSMDWKQFLEDAFADFNEETTDLIIDIRENQGGMDDASFELQKYLFHKKCEIQPFQSQSRFLVFPEEVKANIETWDYWFYDMKGDLHFQEGDYYVFPENQSRTSLKPGKKTYQGNIYLLTSGKNVSGAFYLANTLRECGGVTIIGEETGGNRRGVNGGTILFLKPPHSRININMPIMGSFSKKELPNQGIIPDIRVSQSSEDLINSEDTILKKAVQTILSRRL